MSTLAGAVGLDVADWWEVSAEGYLRHVPKARILAAVEQAAMPAEAATLGKLKKDALVAKAETLLAGTRWLQLFSSGMGDEATKRRAATLGGRIRGLPRGASPEAARRSGLEGTSSSMSSSPTWRWSSATGSGRR